jgi:aspartyl-tRNA(Asn)/glutamyl-tRNA(Gln) amidotransferase subunit B
MNTSISDKFETVIGLEIHVQLNTNSKIFCSTQNQFGVVPNGLTDPITLGLPGSLPVLNMKVVECAILLGLATNCSIRQFTRFARKHYFYPDLPKGYQISQFEEPICENGHIHLEEIGKKIGITRIHMEEDAGKSTHARSSSLVDLNRAGTPLLEVVSEPEMRSSKEAVAYLKVFHQLVTYLGICDGNLEEGNFRCDANVSIRLKGETTFGTKTEIKNLNSFRFVEKAIDYEIARHLEIVNNGSPIIQQTVLFDSDAGTTRPMRTKEEAADYRYFPDPDMPPLLITDSHIAAIRAMLPELPSQLKLRFEQEYGLSGYDAGILTSDKAVATYFEESLKYCNAPKLVCNWIVSELFALLNKESLGISACKITPESFGTLLQFVEKNKISGKIAKQILLQLFAEGGDPLKIIETQSLTQNSNVDELKAMIQSIVAAHPAQFAELQAGKETLVSFFIGQAMKQTKGKANPKLLNELLQEIRSGQ